MAAALQSTMTASMNLATVSSTSSSSFVASESGRALFASPSSFSSSSAAFPSTLGSRYPSVRCGRGDKRTAKGKRFKGSFGNARPKDKSKSRGLAVTPLPPRPPKKEYDDGDFIQVDLDESLFSG